MKSHRKDDLAVFTNTPPQAKSLQHSLEQAAGGLGWYIKANKIMCFKQERATSLS